MRPIWIAVLLAVTASSISADVARFDPPDKRLDKKVTLEVNYTKLDDVAKSLSEQSGVTIKAGTGLRDWKVRERHVTIQAKEIALGKIIDEIERLLGYYVSREGKEGEWTYIIWQDKKSRDLEAEMVTAAKEAAAQRAKETRQSAVDAAGKALKMTPEEARKLRDKDPLAAYMGSSTSGRGFAQLLSSMQSQFPTEYDLMMRGKQAYLPLTNLPPTLTQATSDAASGGLANAMKGKGLPDLTPYRLVIMPFGGSENAEASLMGISGLMWMTGLAPGQTPTGGSGPWGDGMPMGMFPLAGQNSAFGNVFGKMLFAFDEGASLDEATKQVSAEAQNGSFLADTLARKSPTEETPPTDPELTREVEIDPKAIGGGMADLMGRGPSPQNQGKAVAEISRALGIPTLLESFSSDMPIALFVKPGKQPVYKVLIALEKAGYKWDRGDGTLRIRSEDWALKRSYEIPESFIAFYKDLLEKQGELTLDDLAQMANGLTDEQIENTLLKDTDLRYAVVPLATGLGFGGGCEILRFYATLTPSQRQSLSTESGLSFGQLSDAQWERLSTIITDRFGGLDIADGSILLKPLTEDEIKRGSLSRTFDITVLVNGEQEPRKLAETVPILGKQQIAQIQEGVKKAEEDAKNKAEQDKDKTAQPAPQPK